MAKQAERRDATVRAILAAARQRFTKRGFAATSIDDIAAAAGVAKGAVYHHFASKEEIFARVFEEATIELAARVPLAASAGHDLLDAVARGTLEYLNLIAGDEYRRLLLLDGPAVLGWTRWREIDARYLGSLMNEPLRLTMQGRASKREIEAIGHLIAGAVTEAALVCATSPQRRRTARDLTAALVTMLKPLLS